MNISGLRVIHSDWTAKVNNSAELTLDVAIPAGEQFKLSFDFDEEQLLRMAQAYFGQHIYSGQSG
jgi:hypothetical protein